MIVSEFLSELRRFAHQKPSDIVVRDNGNVYDLKYNGVVRSVYEIIIDGDLKDYQGYVCAEYDQYGYVQLKVVEMPSDGDLCVSCITKPDKDIIVDVRCKS